MIIDCDTFLNSESKYLMIMRKKRRKKSVTLLCHAVLTTKSICIFLPRNGNIIRTLIISNIISPVVYLGVSMLQQVKKGAGKSRKIDVNASQIHHNIHSLFLQLHQMERQKEEPNKT